MSDIVEHLAKVASKEGVTTEESALHIIAQKADGGMRDALSLFDQMVSYTQGNVTYQGVIGSLNILDYDYYFRFTELFLGNKISETMLLFDEVLRRGFDGSNFITNLTAHLRDLLVSREEATLQLLEVSADVRDRYRDQAQKCPEKFLIRAIKLCNECDLNYRVSKNKRLLVELTLIQLAQLTEEGDDNSSGRSPRRLKPLFQKAVATASASLPNNSTKAIATPTSGQRVSTPNQPQATNKATAQQTTPPATGGLAALAGLTTPQGRTVSTRKPQSLSLRGHANNTSATTQTATPTQTIAQQHTAVEELPVTEEGLRICWKKFASTLPKEESAMAGRLMNIRPNLSEGAQFTITLDNKLVEQEMRTIKNRIEAYLRQQMQNSSISMEIIFDESQGIHRIYSRVEQFQMMEKRNDALTRLKEAFDLDLQ